MASEWLIGVFGIIGAVVGASATLSANWITTRAQLRLAAEDSARRVAKVRRTACADFLIAVDGFADQARELVARLENDRAVPEIQAAHDAYNAGWDNLQVRCAPVVIAGPSELGQRAQELKGRLGDLADVCEAWYVAQLAGSVRGRSGKFLAAQEATRQARDAFIEMAHRYIFDSVPQAAIGSLGGKEAATAPGQT